MGGGENFPEPTSEPRRARVDGLSMNNSLPFQGVGAVVDKHEAEILRSAVGHIEEYPDNFHKFRDVSNTSAHSNMGNLGSSPGDVAQELNIWGKNNLGSPEGTGSRASSLSLSASTSNSPRAISPFSTSASAPAILAIPEQPLVLPSNF